MLSQMISARNDKLIERVDVDGGGSCRINE